MKAMPEVEDAVIAHTPGETITEQMKGLLAQITVRILGSVKDKEHLLSVMQKIDNTIHIVGGNGEELLLPGIEYEDINGFCNVNLSIEESFSNKKALPVFGGIIWFRNFLNRGRQK